MDVTLKIFQECGIHNGWYYKEVWVDDDEFVKDCLTHCKENREENLVDFLNNFISLQNLEFDFAYGLKLTEEQEEDIDYIVSLFESWERLEQFINANNLADYLYCYVVNDLEDQDFINNKYGYLM